MKSIIQHGIDGFGHQLHGLFSCLILHGINNFNFAGYEYIKKSFRFDHINEEETNIQKEYLIEVVKLFIIKYNISPMKYKTYIHSHEVYNIPKIYDINTLYGLDNAYYFNRINLNSDEQIKHLGNIISMNELFINKYLPKNRLLHNNIVIHIRLGDAMTTGRGDSITKYNESILELLHIFYIKYPNYKYYIHTDGNVDFIIDVLEKYNQLYEICGKKTKLMDVLSDFIYSKIFICGNSGLSQVCSFFGAKELIIQNDDNTYSMPEKNTYKISEFIAAHIPSAGAFGI